MKYEPVIGLEVHAELRTKTKMFCASLNDPEEKHPNINVCPVCLGHPGTLPVPNLEAIRMVQRVGAALQCTLADAAKFDRKNYFYPDLPKGYQISQYDMPFCMGGFLDLPGLDHRIRVQRVHLEEDTGKLLHPEGGLAPPVSLVDFNRAGVPLMELVTDPDLRSGEEASVFAQELQLILRYLGASEANMEKGQMRVEVNISLKEKGSNTLGTKVEIKNLNSFRTVRMAADYEIVRQTELLERGERILQETRGWHDTKQKTFSQRSKEEAHDYRYFPEPDIPPLRFSTNELEEIHLDLPELPQAKRIRFAKEYMLGDSEIAQLIADGALADYFEQMASELAQWQKEDASGMALAELLKLATNYLLSDLQGLLRSRASAINDISITPENFAELIKLTAQEKITSRVAKDVLVQMFETGGDPSVIIKEKGLAQVTNSDEILKIAEKIVENNPNAVSDFRAGKEQALQFLVGQLMRETKGTCNPNIARETFQNILKND